MAQNVLKSSLNKFTALFSCSAILSASIISASCPKYLTILKYLTNFLRLTSRAVKIDLIHGVTIESFRVLTILRNCFPPPPFGQPGKYVGVHLLAVLPD